MFGHLTPWVDCSGDPLRMFLWESPLLQSQPMSRTELSPFSSGGEVCKLSMALQHRVSPVLDDSGLGSQSVWISELARSYRKRLALPLWIWVSGLSCWEPQATEPHHLETKNEPARRKQWDSARTWMLAALLRTESHYSYTFSNKIHL